MKQFKIIDVWISIGLIISSFIMAICEGNKNFLSNYFLAGYFIVGAWQIISMLIHAFNHWFTRNKGARYIYHWLTLIAVVTMPGSFWVLLVTAPFMAIFYTWLCYNEVYKKMKRPLADLK